MARIEKVIAQQQLDPDSGGMPRPQVSTAFADAVQGLGGALGNVAAKFQERQTQKEDFKAENDYRRMQLNLGEQLTTRAADDTIMQPDGTGFHDDFVKNAYTPARQQFLEGLPKRLREKYDVILNDEGADTEAWSIKAASTERDQSYKWYTDQITESNDQLANAIAVDPKGYDNYLKSGMELIDKSGLPVDQKMTHRRNWEKFAQISYLNKMIEMDPEGVLKDLGADPNTLSPTTQLDVLERAVAEQETGGEENPDAAISGVGAVGRLQVMPNTAKDIAKMLGDKAFPANGSPDEISAYIANPQINRTYGRAYLKSMLKRYPGDVEAALIGYHSGPGNADAWLKAGRDNSVLGPVGRKYAEGVLSRIPGAVQAGRSKPVEPNGVTLSFRDRGGKDSVAGEAGLNVDLVGRLKTAAAAFGLKELRINSAHRGEQDNAEAGGAKHSQHLEGNAVDIDVKNMPLNERVRLIQTLSANGITGLGIGSNIIHADIGARRAWGYKSSSGGGEVPAWAQGAIAAHLANKAVVQPGGRGAVGRFATLPYNERQSVIAKADQNLSARYTAANKATAVEQVNMRTSIDNELATLTKTGQGTGQLDETAIATALGEDDYIKFAAEKARALKTYNATNDIPTLSQTEMEERLEDYTPAAGSPTFADDQRVHAAVQKEVDKALRLRASRPDKAALEYPDVKEAYEAATPSDDRPEPQAVQAFVKAMLDRQKEFNIKPGSEAPVPREWALEIGKAFSRVPEMSKTVKLADINASIVAQYTELQKVFGPYTEEVIIYALQQYQGIGKDNAELITNYMTAIEAGGDPLKLNVDDAAEREAADNMAEPGFFQKVKNFWAGEELDATPEDSGPPEPTTGAPSSETVLRAINALNDVTTPEEEAVVVSRYGQAAVDAARRKIEGGKQ